jgi:hypothetical protein
MDDEICKALEEMPEKSRSKLEPHAHVIRELRRKGRTYEEIAQFFAERLNITVAPSTIHAFVRVRARRHQRFRIELPPSLNPSSQSLSTNAQTRRRMEELKRQPLAEPERPRFHYDENEPLELIRKPNEVKNP